MEDNNTEEFNLPESEVLSEEKRIIAEAMEKANQAAAQRRAQLEQERLSLQQEAPEVPEDHELGKHSLQEFNSLARIGKATHTFDYHGNQITLRTLQVGEELEILSRCDMYPEGARSLAYVIYSTALSIETVNGKPYFERLPLGPNDDMLHYRFKEFLKMYRVTIDTMIDEYRKLKNRVQEQGIYAKKE